MTAGRPKTLEEATISSSVKVLADRGVHRQRESYSYSSASIVPGSKLRIITGALSPTMADHGDMGGLTTLYGIWNVEWNGIWNGKWNMKLGSARATGPSKWGKWQLYCNLLFLSTLLTYQLL